MICDCPKCKEFQRQQKITQCDMCVTIEHECPVCLETHIWAPSRIDKLTPRDAVEEKIEKICEPSSTYYPGLERELRELVAMARNKS